MSKAIFTKTLTGLIPANDDANTALAKIKLGQDVAVTVKKERNLAHHKKYWKLMSMVQENLPDEIASQLPSSDTVSDYCKLRNGYFEIIEMPNDQVLKRPKSISFGSMSQDDFEAFYDAAVDVICRDLIPTMTREDVKSQIDDLLHGTSVMEAYRSQR